MNNNMNRKKIKELLSNSTGALKVKQYIEDNNIDDSELESLFIDMVKRNGYLIRYIIESKVYTIVPEKLLVEAVKEQGWALEDILKGGIVPSEKVQLASVKKTGYILNLLFKYGVETSNSVMYAAISNTPGMIVPIVKHIKKVKGNILVEAIRLNPDFLPDVLNEEPILNDKVILSILLINRDNLKHFKELSKKNIIEFLEEDILNIEYFIKYKKEPLLNKYKETTFILHKYQLMKENKLKDITDAIQQLETKDYQRRGGNYPNSDKPVSIDINVNKNDIELVLPFKNTSEETAKEFSERFVRQNISNHLKNIQHSLKIDVYQTGDYHDDWVNSRISLKII